MTDFVDELLEGLEINSDGKILHPVFLERNLCREREWLLDRGLCWDLTSTLTTEEKDEFE